MATEDKRIPFTDNILAKKEEIEGYLKSLVEEYKKIALDVPDKSVEFLLYKYKMKIIGAITRSRAYFFFVCDNRLLETTVKVEDTSTLTKLVEVMDAFKPHYREVADALGIRQALFNDSKEAIQGQFTFDHAKKHALELIREHYSIIENKQEFVPQSFEKVAPSKQIFVVHGHDSEMKVAVARTLEHLGLTPIILGEQSNKGLTIIEKFILHSNVSFAIVLISPEDKGGEKIKNAKEQKYRARQNVIFELGYFLGKLKREQVFALKRSAEGFELPSDYLGVVYSDYDNPEGNWRFQLIKELQENGYPVDANKLTQERDE